MPFGQIVLGPPGSGKTTYCNGMLQYMRATGRPVAVVNLDPANDLLPYKPDVDISDLVCLEEVMEQLKLGPNGGTYVGVPPAPPLPGWLPRCPIASDAGRDACCGPYGVWYRRACVLHGVPRKEHGLAEGAPDEARERSVQHGTARHGTVSMTLSPETCHWQLLAARYRRQRCINSNRMLQPLPPHHHNDAVPAFQWQPVPASSGPGGSPDPGCPANKLTVRMMPVPQHTHLPRPAPKHAHARSIVQSNVTKEASMSQCMRHLPACLPTCPPLHPWAQRAATC